MEKLYGS